MSTSIEYSLADFAFPDTSDPAQAPPEFTAWLARCQEPLSLMEPRLHGAALPRVDIERAGARRSVINLASYNYLGLNRHPDVLRAAALALQEYGTGACGSPILSGTSDLHALLEERLAEHLGRESCLLFNSGYAGGMGSLAGLLRKGDVAILDARCHLCLIDGARVSGAKLVFFDHNDPVSLERALDAAAGRRRLVVLEGVYSMDGDLADLPSLVPVAEAHDVPIFIDEAHSYLMFGETGGGVVEHFGMQGRIALQFGTFSKALAGIGGFTAGDRETLQYLRLYSRPYGFSCALPPSVVAGVMAALDIATRDGSRRETLWRNTHYFRARAQEAGLDCGESESPVIPIMMGSDRDRLYERCAEMTRRGLFLAPIDYPSVPEDALRYRVAITAAHTPDELDCALDILTDTLL
ncbi:MAG: aminotransferase class I/II-fold pyridoxal phosphate-dependent enzyme [Planctomycetota bacterium]